MAQSNGCIASGYGDDSEDKPMLVMKSKGTDNGGHGLTALINRQLQGESFTAFDPCCTVLAGNGHHTSRDAGISIC